MVFCIGLGTGLSLHAQYQKISSGRHFTVAIKNDGSLWAWGRNNYGQLGTGNYNDSSVPVQVGVATNWAAISCGFEHVLAMKSDGTIWAWGRNNYGQLGNGNTSSSTAPVQVSGGGTWQSISAKGYISAGVNASGQLREWGCVPNAGGGCTGAVTEPAYAGNATSWNGFISVSIGYDHGLALKSNGTIWAWGWNGAGQLGTGNYTGSDTPVQIGLSQDWANVSAGDGYSLARKNDGTVWSWGENTYGQLGIGNTTEQLSPAQTNGGNFNAVFAGYDHSFGLKSDNTLWVWGSNSGGVFGDGTVQNSQIPKLVGTQISTVAPGVFHSVISTISNTFCGSGNNTFGALGNGTNTNINLFNCTSTTYAAIELTGDLNFGSVYAGAVSTKTLQIKNTGTSNLSVSAISLPTGFSANWISGIIAPGNTQNVTITFAPSGVSAYGGTITVTSNAQTGGNTISCSGQGAQPPVIIQLSGNMDFGNVVVGGSLTRTLTITNTGLGVMQVTQVQYPSGFSGNWASGYINPGSSQNVSVTFNPLAAQLYGGSIVVTSNATSGNNVTLCTGTGDPFIPLPFPYLDLSTSNVDQGGTLVVNGRQFTPNGVVQITFNGPAGYSFFDELIADNSGEFDYQFLAPNGVSDGYFTVVASDLTENRTASHYFYLLPAINPLLQIISPDEQTLTYATPSQKLEVVWSDFVLPGPGLFQYQYSIEYKKEGATSWTVANASFAGIAATQPRYWLNYAIDLSNESILVNPEQYQVRIVDLLHPGREAISALFNVYAPASTQGVSFEWDYAYPGISTPTHPQGVAADSVARFYIRLSDVSDVKQVRLNLQDAEPNPVADVSEELGRVLPANIIDAYSEEANNAQSTEVILDAPGWSQYYFWYVAPSNFVRAGAGDADFKKSQRLVRALFTITHSDNSTETREEYITIVRPPVMFQHGIFSDETTFSAFKTSDGFSLVNHPAFKVAHSNRMSPNAAFSENADFLLNAGGLTDEASLSLRDLIIEMRKKGYACNRIDYVGHSMGGCVARLAISSPEYLTLGYYGKGLVHRLITLHTPHNGSPLADIGVNICESGVIDSSVAFLQAKTLLLAENIMTTYLGPGGKTLFQLTSPLIEDAYLSSVARFTSYFLNYDESAGHFSAVDAIRDLQVRNNPANNPLPGVRLPETRVNNHLIAGDSPCVLGDLYEDYRQFFQLLAVYSNLNHGSNLAYDPCDNIDLLMESVGDISDFANHSDFVVSTQSQRAKQGPNLSNITIIPGLAHSAPFPNPALTNVTEADRVLQLLNSPVESALFAHAIPETPVNGLAGPLDDRTTLQFETRRDTHQITILSPAPGWTIPVNAIQDIVVALKDTTHLIYSGILFQGRWYEIPAQKAAFKLGVKANGRLGNEQLYAFAYYKNENQLSERWDSVTFQITTPLSPIILDVSPDIMLLKPNENRPVSVKLIYPDFIAPVSVGETLLEVAISDGQVAEWNASSGLIHALAVGETKAVFTWQGLSDTVWLRVDTAKTVSIIPRPVLAPVAQVKAFPNPGFDELSLLVSAPENGIYSFRCFDVLGRMQWRREQSCIKGDQLLHFDTTTLPPGLFFVEIQFGNGRVTTKWIKRR